MSVWLDFADSIFKKRVCHHRHTLFAAAALLGCCRSAKMLNVDGKQAGNEEFNGGVKKDKKDKEKIW